MNIKEAVGDVYTPEETHENNYIIGHVAEDVESKNEVEIILTEMNLNAEDMDQVSNANDASEEAVTENISDAISIGCDALPLETFVCNVENQDLIEVNKTVAEEA